MINKKCTTSLKDQKNPNNYNPYKESSNFYPSALSFVSQKVS